MEARMLEALGGRKFFLTLVVIAIGMATHILSPSGLNEAAVALLVGALGVFGASNAAVSMKALGAAQESEAAADITHQVVAVDLSPIESKITALEASIEASNQGLATIAQSVGITNNLLRIAMSNKNDIE